VEEGFERERKRERDDSLPPPFISLPLSSPPSSVAGGVMNGDPNALNLLLLHRLPPRVVPLVLLFLRRLEALRVRFQCGFSGSCCHSNSREAGKRWFQGTADAMRQFHWLFE
ncbi:hypothetical protein S83_012516, partial [Arachis hypogaea]